MYVMVSTTNVVSDPSGRVGVVSRWRAAKRLTGHDRWRRWRVIVVSGLVVRQVRMVKLTVGHG